MTPLFRRVFASALFFLFATLASAQAVPPPPIAARAWLLYDYSSAQVIAQDKADERMEPASLTKLMTAYLTFSALRAKRLTEDQGVPVSVKAWKTSGSKMFIAPDKPVTVGELIRGMIVQSGNDACVALAEAVAGSEESFAALMNREAARLGMRNTHFVNATGLADPEHYTTAHDLSLLAAAIVRDFPEYYPLYSTREYTYNKITQANRNRLLAIDTSVDGIKTGHTDNAGWCLISSARRDGRRLISVLLGAKSDNDRAEESRKLLNYGFQIYEGVKVQAAGVAMAEPEVFKGQAKSVKVGFTRDLMITLPRGQADKLKKTVSLKQPLVAPLKNGAQVGTLRIELEGRTLGDYPIQTLEAVEEGGLFGRLVDSVRLRLK